MVKNNDVIEKAVQRKVGDMHPNGKWVWTEYKPGKFDWRPPKKNAAGAAGGSSSGSSDTGIQRQKRHLLKAVRSLWTHRSWFNGLLLLRMTIC